MKKALITGSFDPVTLGHYDLIKRTASLFDTVYVVIFTNSEKKYLFAEKERLEILKAVCAEFQNVVCDIYDGLVAEYAKKKGIDVIVRGARNSADYDYEAMISVVNKNLCPGLDTVILPSDPKLSHISSTVVREMIKYRLDLAEYLPAAAIEFVKNKFYN